MVALQWFMSPPSIIGAKRWGGAGCMRDWRYTVYEICGSILNLRLHRSCTIQNLTLNSLLMREVGNGHPLYVRASIYSHTGDTIHPADRWIIQHFTFR